MNVTTFSRQCAVVTVALAASVTVNLADSGSAQASGGWGSISYSAGGASGGSRHYPSSADAESAANDACGYTDCSPLSTFTSCGAVAKNGTFLQGGVGSTLAIAEARALALIPGGDGEIDAWVCN